MQTDLFLENEDNSSIFSVSQITKEVRKSLETSFSQIWVRGEISNLRCLSSGHRYFSLKDSSAQLKAVLFRGDSMGLSYLPQEGDECLAFGDLSVYEPRGEYQIRIRHMMQDGLGNLRMQFEMLKEKLKQEGLFENEYKLSLPQKPSRIAVITSLKGAALQDFLSILKRRHWKGLVFLINSSVQGKSAPSELYKAYEKALSLKNLDLIVVTRGGGSIEDLWAFNDENLVRKIAQRVIPTISAIGHQTDFTLIDFVADFRAETPSAAAELISSAYLSISEEVDILSRKLNEIVNWNLSSKLENLRLLEAQLSSHSPIARIQRQAQALDELEFRMERAKKEALVRTNEKLSQIEHRLENCNLQKILNKGFAYLETEDGLILQSVEQVRKDSNLVVTLKDGKKRIKALD